MSMSSESFEASQRGLSQRQFKCPQSHLRPLDSEMAFFPLENSALKGFLSEYILNLTEGSKHIFRLYNRESRNCGHVYRVLIPTCPENTGSLGQHLSCLLCASDFPVLDSIPRVVGLITTCIGQNWQGFSSQRLQGWLAWEGAMICPVPVTVIPAGSDDVVTKPSCAKTSITWRNPWCLYEKLIFKSAAAARGRRNRRDVGTSRRDTWKEMFSQKEAHHSKEGTSPRGLQLVGDPCWGSRKRVRYNEL